MTLKNQVKSALIMLLALTFVFLIKERKRMKYFLLLWMEKHKHFTQKKTQIFSRPNNERKKKRNNKKNEKYNKQPERKRNFMCMLLLLLEENRYVLLIIIFVFVCWWSLSVVFVVNKESCFIANNKSSRNFSSKLLFVFKNRNLTD